MSKEQVTEEQARLRQVHRELFSEWGITTEFTDEQLDYLDLVMVEYRTLEQDMNMLYARIRHNWESGNCFTDKIREPVPLAEDAELMEKRARNLRALLHEHKSQGLTQKVIKEVLREDGR